MRFILSNTLFLYWSSSLSHQPAFAFTASSSLCRRIGTFPSSQSSTQLQVSIGLGPGEGQVQEEEEKKELVAGVDYEIPDHESYRTSRRSKLDEQCDQWYGALLGGEQDKGILGSLADDARKILLTPVPLVNEVQCIALSVLHLKSLCCDLCGFFNCF
jgi:hypothetical protein